MSRATEVAEREAAEAEAETPDDETPETPEPDEEEAAEEEEQAVTPEPVTEARLRKISEQIAREDDRHEKRLREILGELWEGREVCPLCMQEGFVVPANPGEFDQEQRYAVLVAMGEIGTPKLKKHPFMSRCEACGGAGKWDTESLVEQYKTEQCDACQGMGRIDSRSPVGNVVQFGAPTAQQAWTPPPPPDVPNADVWGRPWGHKDWGQNPAEVNAV